MLKLEDIMQDDVISVAPELTLRDLIGVLTEHDVTGAPVVANGRVVGVVSATDVLEHEGETPGVPVERRDFEAESEWGDAATWDEGSAPLSEYFTGIWEPQAVDTFERMETTDQPEWDILDQHTVGEVMSRRIISLPSDAPVRKAARMMLDADVHRVLVMDGDELRGIVTATDIVRAVADDRLK